MTHNRVEFGLTNVHFAVQEADGFGKPIRMYGAASIQLSPVDEVEELELFGGDIGYITRNKGYQGQLSLALIPEEFSLSCLKNELNRDDILVEYAGFNTQGFALLFEFDGDEHKTRHILFHCIASRPEISSETKGGDTSINTNVLPLRVLPFGDKRIVKGKVKQDEGMYKQWFEQVIPLEIN